MWACDGDGRPARHHVCMDVQRIVALLLVLLAVALGVLEANDVLVLPAGVGETLTGLAGWLGLSRPADAKALKSGR